MASKIDYMEVVANKQVQYQETGSHKKYVVAINSQIMYQYNECSAYV